MAGILPDDGRASGGGPLCPRGQLLLLFCVALEPYLFYVMETVQTIDLADAASVAYALDVGAMFFMLAGLAYLVVREDKAASEGHKRLHPLVSARFKRTMRLLFVVGLLFAVSALPVFWVTTPVGYLRFYMWSPSALLFFSGRGLKRPGSKKAS
jgi:hypothetical protein